jgi:acetylornithine deacetylase
LYGLGSNDAGGSVVSLILVFGELYDKKLPYNIILAITAEEETICINGISALWEHLGKIDFGIVGEPTKMQAAVAECGLLVLDCQAKGIPGHAARDEGDNALYHAVDDIQWFRFFHFPKISERMGKVKMTVTQIQAGTQHNVIPAECRFVVDIRPTDVYENIEIVGIIRQHVKSEVMPRSLHLQASLIDDGHILVKAAKQLGLECYISPTTSDISRIPVPCLKMGPGDSSRSHTADEFIYISDIQEGIEKYIKFLNKLSDLIS